jgi:nitronate monooxygenase
VRFFITSLGNPKWVCERVHAMGGVVYHDVTERKWAEKSVAGGVDGLIAVNARAGGHAGPHSPEALFEELAPFGKPIVSAGGVGTPEEFARRLRLGYAAVQLGTRFIATPECKASDAYKQAIVDAAEDDIVLTERLTGVPVAVIRNAYVERLGTKAGRFARFLLKGRRTKHWVRTWYALNSLRRLKRSLLTDDTSSEYWQAGKSVAGIHEVKPAAQIVREFAAGVEGTPATYERTAVKLQPSNGMR